MKSLAHPLPPALARKVLFVTDRLRGVVSEARTASPVNRFAVPHKDTADQAGKVGQPHDDAGLCKSIQDVQAGTGKGTPQIDRVTFPTSPMDTLTKSMDVIAKSQQRERVQALHGAIDQPGISAHEVARREALRNRADQRGA